MGRRVERAYPSISHGWAREKRAARELQRERDLEAQAPGTQIERRRSGERGRGGGRNARSRWGVARAQRKEEDDREQRINLRLVNVCSAGRDIQGRYSGRLRASGAATRQAGVRRALVREVADRLRSARAAVMRRSTPGTTRDGRCSGDEQPCAQKCKSKDSMQLYGH
jgi:hypothetical protein